MGRGREDELRSGLLENGYRLLNVNRLGVDTLRALGLLTADDHWLLIVMFNAFPRSRECRPGASLLLGDLRQ